MEGTPYLQILQNLQKTNKHVENVKMKWIVQPKWIYKENVMSLNDLDF